MEDLPPICKICKKVFPNTQGLIQHKMAQHSQPKLMELTEGTHQFRNNSISITRIHKETNPMQKQSASNENQNSFRKMANSMTVTSINSRNRELKMKPTDARTKPPFRSPDMKMKPAAASFQQMMVSRPEMDDDTTDWQKWEPAHREIVVTSADANIITPSAAERATSAFRNSAADPIPRVGRQNIQRGQAVARKSVPQLLRMSPNNGKRPAPGMSTQRTTPTTGTVGLRGGAPAGKPVPDILQNLGKMKSMCQPQVVRPNPSPKMISSLQGGGKKGTIAQSQTQVQPFRVNKPPQVSKNKGKITPRNAFNNALPKPGGHKSTQILVESDEMDFDEDLEEEEEAQYTLATLPQPRGQQKQLQTKKPASVPSVPKSNKPSPRPPSNNSTSGGGGKAPPQKSLNANRVNPTAVKKKAAGNPIASRNGRSSPQPASVVKTHQSGAKQSTSGAASVTAKKSSPEKPGKPASQENKLKYLKSYTATMPGSDYSMPKLTAVGSYTNRAGQQVWVCLVCNEKEQEESSRDMICCDYCEDWYHWLCVGIHKSIPEDDPWYCKRCIFQASRNPTKDFPAFFKSNVPP